MLQYEDIPMLGMVAHSGKTFTVNYRINGNLSDIHAIGYSVDVFNDCPGTMIILRFDKSKIEDVIRWIDLNTMLEGYALPLSGFTMMSLEDYVCSAISQGIHVECLQTTYESFGVNNE